MKREELRVKSKETVRLVWLASATARLVVRLVRLAARLARLEIAEIEKIFLSLIIVIYSASCAIFCAFLFCTLLQSFALFVSLWMRKK